ncbi:pyridoxamine 5'-phosphate oxidase family protein [Thalassospira sp. MCCC 1A01428]|uniref:pyridoxamine 5'-phosphate oxidase family protein n=1 Tax=Thalassospira sp. MCCC 1A01428 TaxID=1470575 RepID=UPI000A1D85C3|nr:pyridoxamine 5'-phosphate oxidase family protein [Thalassospira sp. MCCC 1A01428]OSQ45391.1 phosphohydrolase [Thalassospira sp. MCCC 1A01428]
MAKIETLDQLRTIYGDPLEIALQKQLSALDKHCRRFIELSPFAVISSADGKGSADVSPRGDGPGFVHVLDDNTLLMPDRPGNRRLDTLTNILVNPQVGLLFFVPGMNETLRINGTAELDDDPELLNLFAHTGKLPISVIKITVEEAFLHCAKSLMRSRLWQVDAQINRKSFPTLGAIIKDQLSIEGGEEVSQEESDAHFAKSIAERG